ncbi:MAG: hypothetical protein LBB58_05265 [Cellulomonadaceae bacterium]|jgi:hypothetical protein|nr:hypothetical protein [Cellulomonadaceae bacterium]
MSGNAGERKVVSRKALRVRAEEIAAKSGEEMTWGEAWEQARISADSSIAAAATQKTRSAQAPTPVRRSTTNYPASSAAPAKTPPAAQPLRTVGQVSIGQSQPRVVRPPVTRAGSVPPSAPLVNAPPYIETPQPPTAAPYVSPPPFVTAPPPEAPPFVAAPPPPVAAPPYVEALPPVTPHPFPPVSAFDREAAESVNTAPFEVVNPSVTMPPVASIPVPIVEPAALLAPRAWPPLTSDTAAPGSVPSWDSITTIAEDQMPVSSGAHAARGPNYGVRNPRPSAGYTWLSYLILVAVSFILGLLVWQLISGGGLPFFGLAFAPVSLGTVRFAGSLKPLGELK